MPGGKGPCPVAGHLVVFLKVRHDVVGFLARGSELLEHRGPVVQRMASLFAYLLVGDIPVIALHGSSPVVMKGSLSVRGRRLVPSGSGSTVCGAGWRPG